MIRNIFGAFFVGLAITTFSAHAENAAPDNENGRFFFHKAENGVLRFDSRSGQASLCGPRAVGWACQLIPDDRATFEREIGRLNEENAALKQDLIARGLPLPRGVSADTQGAKGADRRMRLPDSTNLDRVWAFFERLWHRLVEMIANVQKEILRKS